MVAKRQDRAQSASEDDPPFRVLVAFQEDGESGAEEKVISKVAEAEKAEEAEEAAKAKTTNIYFKKRIFYSGVKIQNVSKFSLTMLSGVSSVFLLFERAGGREKCLL